VGPTEDGTQVLGAIDLNLAVLAGVDLVEDVLLGLLHCDSLVEKTLTLSRGLGLVTG